MINLLRSGVLMLLLLSGCGWNGTPTRSAVDFAPLTSIEIVADYSTIAVNTSTKLKVIGIYSGVIPDQDIAEKDVVWSVSPDTPGVAEFKSTLFPSRVTGLIAGKTATIVARARGVEKKFTLTVSSDVIDRIVVTPSDNPSVPNGLTQKFTATGAFKNPATNEVTSHQDITFDVVWNAVNSDSTATTNPIDISNNEISKGVATAGASNGTSNITATFQGTTSDPVKMTAIAPVLSSLELSKTNLALTTGATDTLTVTATYSDKSTKDVTGDATWSSTSDAVATVENSVVANKGRVTAVAVGTATVSASFGGKTVTVPATITVTTRPVQSLSILPTSSNVTAGNQASFTATVVYKDDPGKSVDVTKSASWTISQQNAVILVDNLNQPGVVKGVVSGSATLTASFGGLTQSVIITVP